MSDTSTMDIETLEQQLKETREECEKLRKENEKLKAILRSFSLQPASTLKMDTPKQERITSTGKKRSGVKEYQVPQPSKTGSSKVHLLEKKSISDEMIALFCHLFRGREDVYARRWQSHKGRSGYSPACANEWDSRLCSKPCSKCANRDYLPLTDQVILDHLIGKHTVGLYPMLEDETCHLLVVDFDKKTWMEDTQAFLETCRTMDITVYLERSRSGTGGHVWIFFEQTVPASLARKLGSTILTCTMEQRHQVGLDSYDRFFPSQDTLPKGGFGNLIALPLQGESLKRSNTCFLDSDFRPYPNQWRFLSSIQKIGWERAEAIVSQAERSREIIGVRMVADSETEDDPWTLPPSHRRTDKQLRKPFPKQIRIVQGNMLYIPKEDLTSQIINRLTRLASFQNPEFYRAQAMRFSTYDKPRIICCAEEFPHYMALPRGCLDEVTAFFSQHYIKVEQSDERFGGKLLDIAFLGSLNPDQMEIVHRHRAYDTGVLVAPTGFGKTVMAAWMIAQRKVNTLILVHRRVLMDQWQEQLALFLGLPVTEIGLFGGTRKKPTGMIDVAIMQSLHRKGQVNDLVAGYGHVIVDECHHISAFSFEQVLKQAKARYILGLTATPIRKDGHHPIIVMQCGPIRSRVHPRKMADKRPFAHQVIVRHTDFSMYGNSDDPTIHDVYQALLDNSRRNTMIIDDVNKAVAAGRSPLVLTERTAHLDILASSLEEMTSHLIVLRGGMGKKQRVAIMDRLKAIPPDEQRVILATGRYIGEGFDDARLDTLFLALPISWKGTLQQYVGRLHRLHHGKHDVRVYDYVDRNVPMLSRMFQKRLKGYRAIGYSVVDEREDGGNRKPDKPTDTTNEQLKLPV